MLKEKQYMLSDIIEFYTTCQKRHVVCYLKEGRYDIYISGILIKISATIECVNTIRKLL